MDAVMPLVKPYEMASTFAFPPWAIAAATAAIEVLDQKNWNIFSRKGLFSYPRPDGLRISLALNMPIDDLIEGAAILKEALDEYDQHEYVSGEDFTERFH
ncbi:hypothetical protein TSTA_091020 [Talaromyces stipitatus ATCC 10500]|uniref:Uncharacterized protein n=1 Tax=Talaromyces stipitatus (strain ATCC 10500 / CBS 375.48 / QM 6759 / NRRL 1006) TaxID=441959 RepID=B8M1G6_TALSN|nr:uncharacterized protein TSTA_091020 [Talaromyces stipitatus ATCC 10500]EED21862.1 hypothetical protein TSTA_091020 [Talaromyces stipitatus ATCC 10500]